MLSAYKKTSPHTFRHIVEVISHVPPHSRSLESVRIPRGRRRRRRATWSGPLGSVFLDEHGNRMTSGDRSDEDQSTAPRTEMWCICWGLRGKRMLSVSRDALVQRSQDRAAPTIYPRGGRDRFNPETRSKSPAIPDTLSSQSGAARLHEPSLVVFKKSAPNNKLTLYLSSRDLVISGNNIDRLQGVLLVDPEYLQNKKVFGQVALTFRYGREDEEVMGLKFCNEAVMCLAQLYPLHERAAPLTPTPLQEALMKRLGPNARPFTMEVTPMAPPSVQLVPAKEYNGAPIGTSYDVRAYVADRADEKLHRRTTVRMGIRVVQRAPRASSATTVNGGDALSSSPPPHASVEKPFLLSDGRVELEASLNKSIYSHGEPVIINMAVHNNSNKTVRRIKVFVVQHVDVCMFSNGKFKNVVALETSRAECPLGPGSSLNRTYTLQPTKGATKNWIALEDSFSKTGAALASTVTCASNSPEDRNVFAIYVSYYVKVKLLVGAMGGELALKLPFTLMHSSEESTSPCDGTSVIRPLPAGGGRSVSTADNPDIIIQCGSDPKDPGSCPGT